MGTFIMITVYCGPGQYTVYSVNIVYTSECVFIMHKDKRATEVKRAERRRKGEEQGTRLIYVEHALATTIIAHSQVY